MNIALLFDLDGTLIDSVYAHVLAWQQALAAEGIEADCAKLHRRIGMDGSLLMKESARDAGVKITVKGMGRAEQRHARLFRKLNRHPRPTSGAPSFLNALRGARVPWGIATSGKLAEIATSLKAVGVHRSDIVVDGSVSQRAKPEPNLFLECAKRLNTNPSLCFVVGDAIWDVLAARRAGMQAIGLTCGGYSEAELYQAGAFRVFSDPQALRLAAGLLGIDL
ncbi:MAG: HAD family phosphatase [Pseudomonadota bacterium]|nr:HAD family phosphatase [Pseudomonadota bacterium]